MVYKALIFDIDGTLVHTSSEYRYEVVGKTLKHFNCSSSLTNIDRFWFEGDRDKIISDCFFLDPDLFWIKFKELDLPDTRKKYTRAYEDIGFIKEVREKGIKVGAVTGAPMSIANINLDLIGKENIHVVVSANVFHGIEPKPHPQGLEECLNSLSINKKDAAYVGNGGEDIETARNAGVFDVLIIREENNAPMIKPSLTISSLYELRMLI